jgi:hypothetical protein
MYKPLFFYTVWICFLLCLLHLRCVAVVCGVAFGGGVWFGGVCVKCGVWSVECGGGVWSVAVVCDVVRVWRWCVTW